MQPPGGRKRRVAVAGAAVAMAAVALLLSACQPGTTYHNVNSTAYCLRGQMASGKYVYDGAVAMNTYPGTNTRVPFGERFRIDSGPAAGKVVTVEDRIGHGSQFDIWFPSCSGAIDYGRRYISITHLR